MGKRIWILNHYASKQFFNKGGRHYWLAEELAKRGYEPVIFCCNTKGDTLNEEFMPIQKKFGVYVSESGIPFVFIESTAYTGNGISRIKNMAVFAKNLLKVGMQYASKNGKPDVIIASSVHPLTVLAGERLAKRLKKPCICEIRDLWPESIFAYMPKTRNAFYARFLLEGEKYMYKKADAIVMTWAGGGQYIEEQGWSKQIPNEKVTYISNGVNLKEFNENKISFPCDDSDLKDKSWFNVVYTGSIRKVNNLDILVEAAKIIQNYGNSNKIRFLIWGDGNEKELIARKVKEYKLENFILKERVNKQCIPAILSASDCCILHNSSTELDKYGSSQNKFFEYLASGKPIFMTYKIGYSVISKYQCGIELENQTPKAIAEGLEKLAHLSEFDRKIMGDNAFKAAIVYDFAKLTDKYVAIIETLH